MQYGVDRFGLHTRSGLSYECIVESENRDNTLSPQLLSYSIDYVVN
jgi:hypothetical protein